ANGRRDFLFINKADSVGGWWGLDWNDGETRVDEISSIILSCIETLQFSNLSENAFKASILFLMSQGELLAAITRRKNGGSARQRPVRARRLRGQLLLCHRRSSVPRRLSIGGRPRALSGFRARLPHPSHSRG